MFRNRYKCYVFIRIFIAITILDKMELHPVHSLMHYLLTSKKYIIMNNKLCQSINIALKLLTFYLPPKNNHIPGPTF